MEEERTVRVTLPLDADGMLPRECPHCHTQFAVHSATFGQGGNLNLRCPDCLWIARADEYTTASQTAYAQTVAGNELNAMAEDVINDAFDKMFKGIRSTPNFNVSRGRGRVKLDREVAPPAAETSQLAATKCAACGFPFKAKDPTTAACPICR